MGLALMQRRPTLIAALAIGIAIPIFGFGLYWIEHGGWLLPNSLLIKGVAPAGSASVRQTLTLTPNEGSEVIFTETPVF